METTVKENQKIKSVATGNTFHIQCKGSYGSLYFSSAGGNCKLAHISDIGNTTTHAKKPKLVLDRIQEAMEAKYKLCFEVNVCTLDIIKLLNTRFKMVFCTKVPIGYENAISAGYTYFALFLTNHAFQSGGVTPEEVDRRMIDWKKDIDSFEYECQFK